MFSPPIDVLLIFAMTTPALGWILEKVKRANLCGVYASIGLGIAMWEILSMEVPTSSGLMFIDQLGVFMAIAFSMLGFLASIYSIRYMERDEGVPLFFSLFLLMISGMIGCVFAGDMFSFFVFWEMMCIASYTLVAFRRERWEPVEAAFKYLIMSSAGSASILFGMSLLYGMCGTLSFKELFKILFNVNNVWIQVAAIFIFIGLGIKTAIFPLHTWLPDAHSAAPSSISAMLSGVVVETGIYAICRIGFTVFSSILNQWLEILAILSVFTMLVGNLTPLLQTDVKRLLAYSSIAHIGYMLAGISTGSLLGIAGALLHVFNHAIMKGSAFLCSGMILYRLETREMKEMAGVGRRMPLTGAIFSLSLFSLIGLPPLNGFISKLTIIMATIEANMAWLGASVIINSVISAVYYLRTVKMLLQPISSDKVREAREGPIIMLIPLIILACLMIVLGIWPDGLINLAISATNVLLGG